MIVLSDGAHEPGSTPTNGSSPAHQQGDPHHLSELSHAANTQADDDVLDSMLEQQFPGMFDLASLRAAVPKPADDIKVMLGVYQDTLPQTSPSLCW